MKYKVLHVVSTLGYGGVAKMVLNYYGVIDKSKIQFDFVTHGPREDYHNELIKRGSQIFYVKTIGSTNLISYCLNLWQIIKSKETYDAIHIHTDYQGGIPALVAKVAGIPVRICHSHRNDITNSYAKLFLMPLFRKLIFKNATNLMACSKEAGELLFRNKSFSIIKNAIDLKDFNLIDDTEKKKLLKQLDIKDDAFIIGHVGSFNKTKNHMFLLEIFKKISLYEQKNAILILVGDGHLREEITNKCKEMGIIQGVRFLGVRKDIPKIMQLFDCLVLPSLSEGLGIVTIEGQAVGIPCVVSSSVPKEADMGLSLIWYLSLESDLKDWCKLIIRQDKSQSPSKSEINKYISDKGYNISLAVNDLQRFYK